MSLLTLTFEPLLGQPPQEGPAVLAEGGALVVVDFEPVRHVDLEALLVDLESAHAAAAAALAHGGETVSASAK